MGTTRKKIHNWWNKNICLSKELGTRKRQTVERLETSGKNEKHQRELSIGQSQACVSVPSSVSSWLGDLGHATLFLSYKMSSCN